jgi:DNA-directed RNA polymerase III subunit RPC3
MAQEIPFFIKAGDQTGGQFYVDFYMASDDLIKRYLEAYIAIRFGQTSARIFRILVAKKFLEEKTISKIAMISGKEARERLYVLLNAGLVLLQEVPRTVDHAPSRTIFLWTVDMERLRFQFTERLKKGFVNLLSRISSEKEKCSLLISKTERTDVAANPDLLSPSERSQLLSLNRMLNRLQHQMNSLSLEYLAFAHFKP